MASSFRMMLFPPREAMTTAEPPEPLFFQHSEFILSKRILQRIDGRRRGILCNPCILWFLIFVLLSFNFLFF